VRRLTLPTQLTTRGQFRAPESLLIRINQTCGAPRRTATRGFSVRCWRFPGFINQPLAASCRPLPRHTKAQAWHTQSELVTNAAQHFRTAELHVRPVATRQVLPCHRRSALCVHGVITSAHHFAVFPDVNAQRRRIICGMKLNQSNLYLKSAADRRAALRISAQSSSAVEGIRAPFSKGKGMKSPPSNTKAFIAHWKRHVASSDR
jgi:hypothetical protein